MAPSLRRWLIAAGLSSTAIAVAYLPPVPREQIFRDYFGFGAETPERNRADRLGLALRRASERLALADRTDALLRRKREVAGRAGRSADLWVRGSIDPRSERVIRASFDTLVTELGPVSGDVRLVVVIDATTPGPLLTVFPSATDSNACAVLISAGEYARAAESRWVRPWMAYSLSRCAYYARYGLPGPAIQAWLTRRTFDIAGKFPWPRDTTQGLVVPVPAWMPPLLYYSIGSSSSPTEVGCARGEANRCRERILDPGEPEPMFFRVSLRGSALSAGSGGSRQASRTYLADLVREMGPERFARFWRSPLPIESAFADAFGTDLTTWTSRWQIKELGVVPQRTAVPLLAGFEGLLVIAAAFAVAAALAKRREVA